MLNLYYVSYFFDLLKPSAKLKQCNDPLYQSFVIKLPGDLAILTKKECIRNISTYLKDIFF